MFYNFILNGIDRVSRNQMTQYYNLGGLRMADVRAYMNALNITWLRRLIVSENSGWAFLSRQILGIDRM